MLQLLFKNLPLCADKGVNSRLHTLSLPSSFWLIRIAYTAIQISHQVQGCRVTFNLTELPFRLRMETEHSSLESLRLLSGLFYVVHKWPINGASAKETSS